MDDGAGDIERKSGMTELKNGELVRYMGLSVRTMNGLESAGYFYEEQVRDALDTHGPHSLLRIPNFGRKSLNEVIKYFEKKPKPHPRKELDRICEEWANGEISGNDAMSQIQSVLKAHRFAELGDISQIQVKSVILLVGDERLELPTSSV